MQAQDNDLMRVLEAAEYLRCSQSTVWRLIREGQLQRVKFPGRRTFLRFGDVAALLESTPPPEAKPVRGFIADDRASVAEKEAARRKVNKALAAGKLTRPKSCSECRRTGLIHAHHPDYRQPLEVEWLCASCHAGRHSRRQQSRDAFADALRESHARRTAPWMEAA